MLAAFGMVAFGESCSWILFKHIYIYTLYVRVVSFDISFPFVPFNRLDVSLECPKDPSKNRQLRLRAQLLREL